MEICKEVLKYKNFMQPVLRFQCKIIWSGIVLVLDILYQDFYILRLTEFTRNALSIFFRSITVSMWEAAWVASMAIPITLHGHHRYIKCVVYWFSIFYKIFTWVWCGSPSTSDVNLKHMGKICWRLITKKHKSMDHVNNLWIYMHHKISNIRHTKSPNLNLSRLVLQLS